MALADTARLIASLELQDKFSATANKYDRTIAGMERSTATLGRLGGQVSQGIGTAVNNLTRLGVIGVGILGVQVAQGIQSLQRLEEVTVATNAVIESTGGVAGITADEVRRLAEEYESLNATMDDKVIQSAENLLLTFTAINEDAFQPALEAALNMNQALGGGEEGLQNTIIQVGKALQDPIRGLTALKRVGVNFTDAQRDQIRTLVESNRLYEAQTLILAELNTEFGGQFAAAGETATAKFAKFRDAVEDAQMALATAFIPVLEKVADKLTTLLADPATMAALEELGTNLADAFDELVTIAGNLPWTAIGDAFKLMGTGSKALLDAFVGLPPWVQTAVLTGWGLNKLTGGALTGIVGALASGLVRGILGINAGVVNLRAATVVGGGVAGGAPVAGTGGGVITKLLGVTSAGVLGALIGSGIGHEVFFDPTVKPAVEFEQSQIDRIIESNDPGRITLALDNVKGALAQLDDLGPLKILAGDQYDVLVSQRDTLQAILDELPENGVGSPEDQRQGQQFLENIERAVDKNRRETGAGFTAARTAAQRDASQTRQQLENLRAIQQRQHQTALSQLASQGTSNFKLAQLVGYGPPRLGVTVISNVTISEIQRKITSQQIAIGKGPLEF